MSYLLITFYIIIIISIIITSLPLLIGETQESNKINNQPFERGIERIELTRSRFSLPFFIITLIFVMFDLEVVFLLGFIPLIRFRRIIIMQRFIVFIFIGLLYEWKYNKFNWIKCCASIILICWSVKSMIYLNYKILKFIRGSFRIKTNII